MRISSLTRSLALAAASVGMELAVAQQPLAGDWCDNRTYLADNGVTFQLDVAQFYQGVASGGLNQA